jgi:hypothetical protein
MRHRDTSLPRIAEGRLPAFRLCVSAHSITHPAGSALDAFGGALVLD